MIVVLQRTVSISVEHLTDASCSQLGNFFTRVVAQRTVLISVEHLTDASCSQLGNFFLTVVVQMTAERLSNWWLGARYSKPIVRDERHHFTYHGTKSLI